MSAEGHTTGWMIDHFQTWVALWAWAGAVLLHVVTRLARRPSADPIRPSGPID